MQLCSHLQSEADRAIPGMTHEKERETMYEAIGKKYEKKRKRIASEYRERQKMDNG